MFNRIELKQKTGKCYRSSRNIRRGLENLLVCYQRAYLSVNKTKVKYREGTEVFDRLAVPLTVCASLGVAHICIGSCLALDELDHNGFA